MAEVKNYFQRIEKLISENLSDIKISEIISEEYNINISPIIIKGKRSRITQNSFKVIRECDFEKYIKNYNDEYVYNIFKSIFKSIYINIKTGNNKLDEVIKTIVKDNVITPVEEVFLKQKAKELGLTENIIDKAKQSLFSNNPYLDNIIHLIFEDGIITNEELDYLKEKSKENDFTNGFVNKRFWTLGVSAYLDQLIKLKNFDKLVKLLFIAKELDFKNLNNDMWLFTKLNIFNQNSFDVILDYAVERIQNDLIDFIKSSHNIDGKEFIKTGYKKINVKSFDISDLKIENDVSHEKFMKILNQEKIRLGSPEVNLLAENIKYRIENNLWD